VTSLEFSVRHVGGVKRVACEEFTSVYAPINVNPEGGGGGGGGGGREKGGDLMNQVVPWVGIWTDTFFYVARGWGFLTD
jgi:hypothetical protein